MNIISKAHKFADRMHAGQFRKFSSIPYIDHPKEVAYILLTILEDVDSELLAAAVLHDVPEDCFPGNEEEGIDLIDKEFGLRIANIVREVTNDREEIARVGKAIYLARRINVMSLEALLLKLADRYHNVETLLSKGEARRFVEEYWKQTSYALDNLDRQDLEGPHKLLLGNIRSILDHVEQTILRQ